jgi:hypothetical protein
MQQSEIRRRTARFIAQHGAQLVFGGGEVPVMNQAGYLGCNRRAVAGGVQATSFRPRRCSGLRIDTLWIDSLSVYRLPRQALN